VKKLAKRPATHSGKAAKKASPFTHAKADIKALIK